MSKKMNDRSRVPAGPLCVIETFPPPAETEPYPAPWGTNSMPELNHGPEDTIAVTAAGKAFIGRYDALPPGFAIFIATGMARRAHDAAVAGRLAEHARTGRHHPQRQDHARLRAGPHGPAAHRAAGPPTRRRP